MLVAQHITKKFSGVTALSNVTIELHPGKVNAIIGENGAGKSTLMKILSGVYTDYEGRIEYNNELLQFTGTRDAEQKGIAIIHQELNLVPHLNITENIFLGRELTNSWGILDKKAMRRKTRELLKKVNLATEPDDTIASLKVGQQQLVEIARALYTNASVIIMDEPTSAISDKEVLHLFDIIRELRNEGKIIVYISHKLKELFTIADRYIVMRDGCTVDQGDMSTITQEMLIERMTGRQGFGKQQHTPLQQKEEILRVEHLSLKNTLYDISFSLHKGEILGLYGLMGAGRTELMETLFGLHAYSGDIFIGGKGTIINNPRKAMQAGLALVPEDRKQHGLILNAPVKTNISITILQQLERWGVVLHKQKETVLCKDYIKKLAIKTSSENTPASNLSGGNQQKIVLAKWLATQPGILLLDEPTRGVDINAKFEIYQLINELAAGGMGILLVSSELPEILAVSHRVLVMAEGRLTADLPGEAATESIIVKHAIQHN
jgi:ABC-type sugar transport system, ATPase component